MANREITDRDTAQKKGQSRFYTGVPCKRGHLTDRYVVNGGCVECVNRAPAAGVSANATNARPLGLIAWPSGREPNHLEILMLTAIIQTHGAGMLARVRMAREQNNDDARTYLQIRDCEGWFSYLKPLVGPVAPLPPGHPGLAQKMEGAVTMPAYAPRTESPPPQYEAPKLAPSALPPPPGKPLEYDVTGLQVQYDADGNKKYRPNPRS